MRNHKNLSDLETWQHLTFVFSNLILKSKFHAFYEKMWDKFPHTIVENPFWKVIQFKDTIAARRNKASSWSETRIALSFLLLNGFDEDDLFPFILFRQSNFDPENCCLIARGLLWKSEISCRIQKIVKFHCWSETLHVVSSNLLEIILKLKSKKIAKCCLFAMAA